MIDLQHLFESTLTVVLYILLFDTNETHDEFIRQDELMKRP